VTRLREKLAVQKRRPPLFGGRRPRSRTLKRKRKRELRYVGLHGTGYRQWRRWRLSLSLSDGLETSGVKRDRPKGWERQLPHEKNLTILRRHSIPGGSLHGIKGRATPLILKKNEEKDSKKEKLKPSRSYFMHSLVIRVLTDAPPTSPLREKRCRLGRHDQRKNGKERGSKGRPSSW